MIDLNEARDRARRIIRHGPTTYDLVQRNLLLVPQDVLTVLLDHADATADPA